MLLDAKLKIMEEKVWIVTFCRRRLQMPGQNMLQGRKEK